MTRVIVDTNVAVVANGGADHASLECELAAVERLQHVMSVDHIVLDNLDLICEEYRGRCSMSGEPGVGDVFVKWVHDIRFNPEFSTRVSITPRGAARDDFDEFPNGNPDLVTFDRDDRKFIAVAVADGKRSTIIQAVDSKWWEARHAFDAEGIEIEFICPEIALLAGG